eukprot:gb/GFBE01007447.1/.p1 GENE.gb/GFBE01007447.1/~~gb/GFBE01007447.1/.p1  ORF type:complete len:418 (+),score=60.94 gb/GFBE01007447.1/:1-1254(+)
MQRFVRCIPCLPLLRLILLMRPSAAFTGPKALSAIPAARNASAADLAAAVKELSDLPPDVLDALMRPVGPLFHVELPAMPASATESHAAVYVLSALMLLAISPLAFQKGLGSFVTAAIYLVSLSVVKVLVKTSEESGFAVPYSLTLLHMLTTAAVSACMGKPKMSEAMQVLPVGLSVGSSLLCNNTALLYGGVAFIAMVGCSTPAVTFFLQLIFGRASFSMKTLMPILVVCGGSVLCVTGETTATVLGFILGGLAAVLRAVKAVMIHECLLKDVPAISVVFWSAAWTVIMALPLAIFFEGRTVMMDFRTASAGGVQAMLASAVAATCLNISQCYTVKTVGPLHLNIIGNLNLLVVIMIAVSFLHETVAPLQFVGIGLLVTGAIFSRVSYGTQKDDTEKMPLINQMCTSTKTYSDLAK